MPRLVQIRLFSTASRRLLPSKQQLFEPYTPPLNEKQKKKLRKELIRHAPHWHSRGSIDAKYMLRAYGPSSQREAERDEALQNIRTTIRAAYGEDFDVVDISLGTYGHAIHVEPLRLVIVDRKHTNGIPPGTDPNTLSPVYDPSALARTFLAAGYTGVFPAYEAHRFQRAPRFDGVNQCPSLEIQAPTIPWPDLQRETWREIDWPAFLIISGKATPGVGEETAVALLSPSSRDYSREDRDDAPHHRLTTFDPPRFEPPPPLTIHLSLPGPTILPLHRLLKRYCAISEQIPMLISLVYLWLRSWGIVDFGGQALALTVINFLIASEGLPNLLEVQKHRRDTPANPETSTGDPARSRPSTSTFAPEVVPKEVWVSHQYPQFPEAFYQRSSNPRDRAGRGRDWRRERGLRQEGDIEPTWVRETVVVGADFFDGRVKWKLWSRKIGPIFHDFLQYISNIPLYVQRESVISIDHPSPSSTDAPTKAKPGGNILRPPAVPLLARREIKVLKWRNKESVGNAMRLDARTFDPKRDVMKQPPKWRFSDVVVQDPFILTHNHAELTSRATWQFLLYKCFTTTRLLRRAHALPSVFGMAVLPQKASPAFVRLIEEANAPERGDIEDAEMELREWSRKAMGLDREGQGRKRRDGGLDGPEDKEEDVEEDEREDGEQTLDRSGMRFAKERPPLSFLNGAGGNGKKFYTGVGFGLAGRGFHTSAAVGYQTKPNRIAETPIDLDEKRRRQTVNRVEVAIKNAYGYKYRVSRFGSTKYGVSSPNSDLDLIIIDPDLPNGFPPQVKIDDLPKVYKTFNLSRTLHKAGFSEIKAVPGAAVPIVKFKDKATGITCDINVNHQLGLKNTNLIAAYCEISPILRPMIKVIKKWAKPLGLNSPGRGAVVSFSSYALVLLAIARLQMNGQLPNLQAGLPALQPDDKTGIWWISSRGGRKRTKCDARFAPNPQWVPKNPMVLKEALLDWFTFYGEKFVAADQLVSIRHGKLLPRPARSGEPDVEPVLEAEPNQEFEEDTPENLVENLEDDRFGLKRTSFDEVLIQPKVNEDVDDGDQTAEYEEDIPLERREDDSLTVIEDEDHIIHTQGWRNHAMIIIDPFVREKNVARNVGKAVVQRFIADCQRASKLLRSGMSLEELIGEEKHPSKRRESSNIVNPGMGGPVKFALDQLLGDMDKNSSKRREPSHTANPGKGKPGKVALDPHPKDMDKKRKEPSDTVNPGKGKPSNVALDHIDTKTRNRIMEKIRLASLAINRNRGSSRSEMDSVPSHPGLSTLHHHGTTDSLPASAPEPRMDAGLELKNAVEPPPSRPAFSDDESARLLNNELSKARARLGKQQ